MKVPLSSAIILFLLETTYAREKWIDPHDMGINTRRQVEGKNGYSEKWTDPHDMGINSRRLVENTSDNLANQYASYLRKAIAVLLLNKVKFDHISQMYSGQLHMELDEKDYTFLRNFVSSQSIGESTLRQIDKIIDNCVQDSIFDSLVFTYFEQIFNVLCDEKCILSLVLLGTLLILWKIQPQNYKISTLFKLFFPLVYIADFTLRYIALLEEGEVDQYLKMKDYEGYDPSNEGWIDWFLCKFSSCEDKRKIFLLSQRAVYHVKTPLTVIGQQFDVIVPIFESLGQAFGRFIMSMIHEAPWYGKLIMALLAFILVIVMLLMIGSHVFQISPRFNIGYLLQLEFLHKEHMILKNNNRKDNTLQDRKITVNNYIPGVDGRGLFRANKNITFKTKRNFKVTRRKTLNNSSELPQDTLLQISEGPKS